jgi:hypothetical protein
MKKTPKTISEGIVDKFIRNVFDNIINKRRQANKKALKTDPQLRQAEEKLAQAYDDFKDVVTKRKEKYGF